MLDADVGESHDQSEHAVDLAVAEGHEALIQELPCRRYVRVGHRECLGRRSFWQRALQEESAGILELDVGGQRSLYSALPSALIFSSTVRARSGKRVSGRNVGMTNGIIIAAATA